MFAEPMRVWRQIQPLLEVHSFKGRFLLPRSIRLSAIIYLGIWLVALLFLLVISFSLIPSHLPGDISA